MSGENLIKVSNPESVSAETSGKSGGPLPRALSLLKVSAYLFICFATAHVLQPAVLYAYHNIPNTALFYFSVSAFDCSLAVLSLFLFAKFFDKRPFLSYGFSDGTTSGAVGQFCVGMATAAVMVSSVMLVLYLAGAYSVIGVEPTLDVLTYLPFFFVAALREEVMMRGYVLQTLEKNWGTLGAIIISSLLFGFLHLINFEEGVDLPARLYSCLCLSIDAGLVFAVAYLTTRRLWFPFGLHFAWNIFEGPVYGTLVSSLNLCKPVLQSKLSGPFYLTGGVFGPEASLVEVAVCLLLVGILWPRVKVNLERGN